VPDQEAHVSLYRRYRPRTFSEVVGQEEIVRTLVNAVRSGEVAHAYLFSGERGIGKTSIARILTRAVNCERPSEGEPCNVCGACSAILSGKTLDVVEIDGASNRGIDHIRRLREEVNFAPADLSKKAYVIDEVHMLTNEAFNALLKTLEEPPAHAMFAFATTEPHKVPRTIISRCQAFEFRKIPADAMERHLVRVAEAEGTSVDSDAIRIIAHRANGGLRDALVMLEQAMSYGGERVTASSVLDMLGLVGRETHQRFLEAIERNERRALLEIVESIVNRGKDLEVFLDDVIHELRDRIAGSDRPSNRELAVARRLLDVKASLFRSLDRRIHFEIGVLQLLAEINPQVRVVPEPRHDDGEKPRRKKSVSAATPSVPKTSETFGDGAARSAEEPETSREQAADADDLVPGWADLLHEIESERIAIAAFLTEGSLTLSEQRLVISFHPEHTFHKEGLEKQANYQYLAGAIRRRFGDDVRLELTYDGAVEKKPLPHEQLRDKARLVCEAFEGEVVKEEW